MISNKLSVFGSTGFIGSRYCEMYPNEVIHIDRNSISPESNNILYFISTVDNYNVFNNPCLDIETNLIHLVKVLESCRDIENLTFNFISSWFVYGKTKDLPANEESHCNPNGFYSITKRAAEQLIISYCETFKIDYRILRLSNVYGFGDQKTSKKKNAMQHMVNEILENRDINIYNNGNNIRDFLHVDDVCRAINLTTQKQEKNSIINIGSGIPHRIIDIVSYVKEKTGSISKFNFITTPDFHKVVQIEDMYLDVTRLHSLGFKQEIEINKGLDIIIESKNLERLK